VEGEYKQIKVRYLDGKDVLFHRVKKMEVDGPFFVVHDVDSIQHLYEKIIAYKIPLERVQYISEARIDETIQK
jgi:hypothetical protein